MKLIDFLRITLAINCKQYSTYYQKNDKLCCSARLSQILSRSCKNYQRTNPIFLMLKQSKLFYFRKTQNNLFDFSFYSKATVEQLEQFYMLCPGKVKDAYLFHLLKEYTEKNPKSSVIVFTNTCRFENSESLFTHFKIF